MRITAVLALAFICTVTRADTNAPIKQTLLSGKLAKIKLALNQPLPVWQQLDGVGQAAELNLPGKNYQQNFVIGEYTLFVIFDHSTGLATQVSVYMKNEDEALPVSDANLIAASVGLKNPVKNEVGGYDWGKSGDPIFASYFPSPDGSLVIELAAFAASHR